ncbi:MVB sorting pathway protein [Schizosaccharomyces cryophilus OY26]|uniref:MVB sorting pathway protein n=1 Tax=Schizosaccharomyces cryophilus (strain OY26 / ATCC MYA-4695 / CBS 11777 / NBRC 106824 / NRRL Y48691) TaxID=653667 RepID=S9X4N0_SCHCR|nr:MVB sorting pathway protein [Schizosaccharomyces cryophilus OY26]EPY52032.1 MVB sorting pathway protein [Schizosaccharomyces cryophilus OY26]
MSRLQLQFKLAAARMEILRKKEEALAKQARRTVAYGLKTYSPTLARARVEPLITQDVYMELLELLQVDAEILANRTSILEKRGFNAEAPWKSSLYHVLAAAPQLPIKELKSVHDFLVRLYGKEFTQLTDPDLSKNDEQFYKLLYPPIPSEELVNGYIEELRRTYFPEEYQKEEIPSSKEAEELLPLASSSQDMSAPSSTQDEVSKAGDLRQSTSSATNGPSNGTSTSPLTSKPDPKTHVPPVAKSALHPPDKPPSFEELAARLDNLKRS